MKKTIIFLMAAAFCLTSCEIYDADRSSRNSNSLQFLTVSLFEEIHSIVVSTDTTKIGVDSTLVITDTDVKPDSYRGQDIRFTINLKRLPSSMEGFPNWEYTFTCTSKGSGKISATLESTDVIHTFWEKEEYYGGSIYFNCRATGTVKLTTFNGGAPLDWCIMEKGTENNRYTTNLD